jgi:hypothetical protein
MIKSTSSNSTATIDFITTENIELLWEIILDDIKEYFKTPDQTKHARDFFISQAAIFYEREKSSNQNLIQLNKKFISQIMVSFSSLKQPHASLSQKPQPQDTAFTIEQLHKQRMDSFKNSLEKRKEDFNHSMVVPVPETPDFSDNTKDEPIGSAMGDLIARTLAQRNFELENIHKSVTNKEAIASWLQPAETSIKTEKIQNNENSKITMEQKQTQYQYVHQTTPKLIQIGPLLEKTELTDELESQVPPQRADKKQITWGKNSEYEASPLSPQNNIFSKLKVVKEQGQSREQEQYVIKEELNAMNERINSLNDKINEILNLLSNENKKIE